MLRTPSSRRKKKENVGLNLTPILDAVFIFIFFLLMSANFIKINEISSEVPIISNKEPPKTKKKPLALAMDIVNSGFVVKAGIPQRILKRIKKTPAGEYNFVQLHDYLVSIKRNNILEEDIILDPKVDINYDIIIQIMDSVRMLNKTDDTFYKKDQDGLDVPVKSLFSKIIFGNLMS